MVDKIYSNKNSFEFYLFVAILIIILHSVDFIYKYIYIGKYAFG